MEGNSCDFDEIRRFIPSKKVVCDTDYWQRDQVVQFKHVDTGVYLGSSGQTFGRPISGQMEIIGISRPDGSTKWRTQEVWWFGCFP